MTSRRLFPGRVVEILPQEESTDSILSSEIVVVGGRGALEDDNFTLVKEFADKIGAAIGGTRPMVDTGTIPFDHQIGQTGLTIRPKICISLGVSGAIQHTEGIKDTKLFVAVNTDENAAIFKVATMDPGGFKGSSGKLHETVVQYN